MKKAYTITPAEFEDKLKEIRNIGSRNGHYDYETGKYVLSNNTPEATRRRFEKLSKEVEEAPEPNDSTFFRNPDIYNLWLNKDTDEPVTARELYNIVEAINGAIKDAERRASYSSNWDGHV